MRNEARRVPRLLSDAIGSGCRDDVAAPAGERLALEYAATEVRSHVLDDARQFALADASKLLVVARGTGALILGHEHLRQLDVEPCVAQLGRSRTLRCRCSG